METEDRHAVLYIPLPGLNADCGHTDVQTMIRHMGYKELGTFDALHDRRANLVKYSASTIGTFHSRKSSEALWCDFLVTTVTNVDHKISPLGVQSKEPNRVAFLGRTQLMKLFLWWCPDPVTGPFHTEHRLLQGHCSTPS